MKSSARAMYALQILAHDHGIEHSVFQQKLGTLETPAAASAESSAQSLAARRSQSGRMGFGDVEIAQHGKRCGHSARGRDRLKPKYTELAPRPNAPARPRFWPVCIRLITPSIMRAPPDAETTDNRRTHAQSPSQLRA
jgi:hypothetical protein